MASRDAVRLIDPVPVHTSASNIEAHMIVAQLIAAGVPASAVEDGSLVGLSAVGPLAGVHRPQVFVGKDDFDAAVAVIRDGIPADATKCDPDSFCYHCGSPVAASGTTICPECGAALRDDSSDSAAGENRDEIVPSGMGSFFQRVRWWYALLVLIPIAVILLYALFVVFMLVFVL